MTVLTDTAAAPAAVTPGLAVHDIESVPVTLISNRAGLDQLAGALRTAVRVACDTETEMRPEMDDDGIPGQIRTVQLSIRDTDDTVTSWVIDMRDVPAEAVAPLTAPLELIGWNANFDDRVFMATGLTARRWWDCQLADGVLHLGSAGFSWWHGLAWASKKYLGLGVDGKGTTQLSYDLTSDLTDDQVTYAARDATLTLWVGEHLMFELDAAGLSGVADLEINARPFIAAMSIHGIEFQMDDWLTYVQDTHVAPMRTLEAEIADLVGGGNLNLFGEVDLGFSLSAPADVAKKLNEICPDEVRDALGSLFRAKIDPVDDSALKRIDHPLAKALLAWRKHDKVVSTYGENLRKFWRNGRLVSRYKQALVATGRLASDKPNAQNFDKGMKKRARAPKGRLIVYADYSQAELRLGGHLSGEPAIINAYVEGRDLHTATASSMFERDLEAELAREDLWEAFASETVNRLSTAAGDGPWDNASFFETNSPARLGKLIRDAGVAISDDDLGAAIEHRDAAREAAGLRGKAKAINFGIIYGLGAKSLALQFTENGNPTTTEEATELLEAWKRANPILNGWLEARDAVVDAFADDPGVTLDWETTLRLFRLRRQVDPVRKRLRKDNGGRWPDPDEIAWALWPELDVQSYLNRKLDRIPTEAELAEEWERRITAVAWSLEYEHPVVVDTDGNTVSFESRTPGDRRRIFQVETDKVLLEACMFLVNHRHDKVKAVVDDWVKSYKRPNGQRVYLFRQKTGRDGNPTWVPKKHEALKKEFEDRQVRLDLVDYVRSRIDNLDRALTNDCFKSCVRGLRNRYRNHPIQGGVGDIGLAALALVWDEIRASGRDIVPIQMVHDSVSLECSAEDAPWLARTLKRCMETAFRRFCTTVPVVADADIRTSLSDDSVVAKLSGMDISWKVEPDRLGISAEALDDGFVEAA